MEIPRFPEFNEPGVPYDRLFMLYGASNFDYYMSQVQDALSGNCPFCNIDPSKNRPMEEFHNRSWLVWDNIIAPRADQEHQFVIPCRRHIFRFSELTRDEAGDLRDLLCQIDEHYGIGRRGTDGAFRCAVDSAKLSEEVPHFALGTAQSVWHFHVNYHVPTGTGEVRVTFAKPQDDLLKKREVLKVWEKMRIAKLAGNNDPMGILEPYERLLVDKKMKPPQLKPAA